MAKEQLPEGPDRSGPGRFRDLARRSSVVVAGAAFAVGTMAGWAYGLTGGSAHPQSPQAYMTTQASGTTGETTSTEPSEETTVPHETTTTEVRDDTTTTVPHETTTTLPEGTVTTLPESRGGGETTETTVVGGGETTETTVFGDGSYMSNPERCRPPGHPNGNLPHGRAGNPAHVPNCRWGR